MVVFFSQKSIVETSEYTEVALILKFIVSLMYSF